VHISVYSLHCIVLLFVCLFTMTCIVLFGLMAARLNKHYYYYAYIMYEIFFVRITDKQTDGRTDR